ncbi:TetR/AcrR family transcriptional regulator [Sulfitobacter mediterraneus]|uniref:TetR/AcrR family transcriptional regulator n=1 Tax=Sulfitobacter mediterraneus TaxID=83219 RepID=UPI001931592E|nr:TetR/AcrR family transcriptional regulator [Sulfitobacter mediterraneus]MBM1642913.1 TetR/AcrR family transcriptional regulator [Sulfitobacter mediterraneus]MBM1646961.1 TetR/AcrR family transcriptional regulator [Sulfitobacter mediterraneus]MBM1655096.1 TetR/AcrR family transcriptional regulator [Sulfitobacter mediterraneus]MBM1659168.1 TetR/AcrR family transcriptional regulator [Sulfitobacter mediterraneus]MBM1667261.1 TetR/AcrR family transcriptional regulator [Sulfitobacter mediterraneu
MGNDQQQKVSSVPSSEERLDREAALREFRRNLILDGAGKVFAEDGFDRATMRRIAAAAGCTTGAIYPIFSGKEEIYAGLLMRSLDALQQAVSSAFAEAEPGWAKVVGTAHAFLRFYVQRPSELALGLHLFSNGIGQRGLTRSLDADLNEKLWSSLSLIELGLIESGLPESIDPRRETMTLFAALSGTLVSYHTGRLKVFGQTGEEILNRQLELQRAALTHEPHEAD